MSQKLHKQLCPLCDVFSSSTGRFCRYLTSCWKLSNFFPARKLRCFHFQHNCKKWQELQVFACSFFFLWILLNFYEFSTHRCRVLVQPVYILKSIRILRNPLLGIPQNMLKKKSMLLTEGRLVLPIGIAWHLLPLFQLWRAWVTHRMSFFSQFYQLCKNTLAQQALLHLFQ